MWGGTIFSQAPTEGLAAHYYFNDDAIDFSGNNCHAQTNRGITAVEDRFGNAAGALHFDGSTATVSLKNRTSFNTLRGSWTISVWLKVDSTNNNDDLYLPVLCEENYLKGATVAPRFRIFLEQSFYTSAQTKVISSVGDINCTANLPSSPIRISQWHFVALSYDGQMAQLYVDGKMISAFPYKQSSVNSEAAINIGYDAFTKKYFCGALDELRVYNYDLNYAELQRVMKDETGKRVITYPKAIAEVETKPEPTPEKKIEVKQETIENNEDKLRMAEELKKIKADALAKEKETPSAEIKTEVKKDTIAKPVAKVEVPVVKKETTVKTENLKKEEVIKKVEEVKIPEPDTVAVRVEVKQQIPESNAEKLRIAEELKKIKAEALRKQAEITASETQTEVKKEEVPVKKATAIVEETKKDTVAKPKEEVKPVKEEKETKTIAIKLMCPEDITQTADKGKCGAKVKYAVGAKPGTRIVQNKGLPSDAFFPMGNTMNVFSADGNASSGHSCFFNVKITDAEAPEFKCIPDSIVYLKGKDQKGIIFRYNIPVAKDNCKVDSVIQTIGSKSGCFLPVGEHNFGFAARDKAGNFSTCSFRVIVQHPWDIYTNDTLPPIDSVIYRPVEEEKDLPVVKKIDDSVHYEYKLELKNCAVTVYMYDDGAEDNDTISVFFNGKEIVNHEMIRIKQHGAIKRIFYLNPSEKNELVCKAWNTGKFGSNTLRMDVYEGEIKNEKTELKGKVPQSKILHSRPGIAGGVTLKCD